MIYKNLYIIGNGFDIYHGIKSRFSDYRKWLENNNPDLYYKLVELYEDASVSEWWNDFENHLADFNILDYAFRLGFENQPDFASDDFRERDRYVAQLKAEKTFSLLSEEIRDSLYKWISQLSMPEEPRVIIEQVGSFFLTFNYTHTLEDIYHIPNNQVLHIHGNLTEEESIIYGHGTDRDDLNKRVQESLPKAPVKESLSEDEYYNVISDYEIEHSTQLAIEATLLGVASLQKNVTELINKNGSFFEQISEIERVFMYGFSFSSIDLPYLEEIVKRTKPEIHWVIFWYSKEDKRRIMDFVTKYNIQNITIIKGIKYLDIKI